LLRTAETYQQGSARAPPHLMTKPVVCGTNPSTTVRAALRGRPGVVRWIFRPLNQTSHLSGNLGRSPPVKTKIQTHRPVCSISTWLRWTRGYGYVCICGRVEYA